MFGEVGFSDPTDRGVFGSSKSNSGGKSKRSLLFGFELLKMSEDDDDEADSGGNGWPKEGDDGD